MAFCAAARAPLPWPRSADRASRCPPATGACARAARDRRCGVPASAGCRRRAPGCRASRTFVSSSAIARFLAMTSGCSGSRRNCRSRNARSRLVELRSARRSSSVGAGRRRRAVQRRSSVRRHRLLEQQSSIAIAIDRFGQILNLVLRSLNDLQVASAAATGSSPAYWRR